MINNELNKSSAYSKPAQTSFSKKSLYNNIESVITYDLLVCYTPAAESAAGDINGLINTAVDESNLIYYNSEATPRIGNLYKSLVNYTEVSMEDDLEWVQYNSHVKNLRDFYGADVVVLIVSSGSDCGQAATLMEEINPDEAYAVVRWDCARDVYTLTHEIGHLFGCEHEVAEDTQDTYPVSYNHGWTSAINTIMAIRGEHSIPRLPYLSTPLVQAE